MATRKKPAAAATADSAPVAETAAPEAPDTPESGTGAARGPGLKIKDLVARVVEATGGKRKEVKEVVEATLAAIGEALARGEDLNLPGIGRARVTRKAEKDGASHLTLKVKRGPHRHKAEEPLADEPEDS